MLVITLLFVLYAAYALAAYAIDAYALVFFISSALFLVGTGLMVYTSYPENFNSRVGWAWLTRTTPKPLFNPFAAFAMASQGVDAESPPPNDQSPLLSEAPPNTYQSSGGSV
jgi:hypothetical protein